MITQIIYISRPRDPMGSASDKAILEEARTRNETLGLTGFLFRTKSAFLQLLEGPAEHVERVMDLIRTDSRHHDIYEWPANVVEDRSFPDWRMGYDDVLLDREEEFISELQTPGFSFAALRAHVEFLAEGSKGPEEERPLLSVARKMISGSDPEQAPSF